MRLLFIQISQVLSALKRRGRRFYEVCRQLLAGTGLVTPAGVSRIFTILILVIFSHLHAEEPLQEMPWAQLSDRSLAALGLRALTVRAADWHHAETANFIYHYYQSAAVAPVSVEAEFYYRVIATELGKDTAKWERKAHIFIFDAQEDWKQFQQNGGLDPWTGGIHSGNELFLLRDARLRWKGDTLGHEITHLVLHRFFGSGIPLWLNEGFAEYSASRCYAAFLRARNYTAKPTAHRLPDGMFTPLAELTSAVIYPQDGERVSAFYAESEKLVRFLSAADKPAFQTFLEEMSHGAKFDTAISRCYRLKWLTTETLEKEFRTYATQPFVPATP